MLPTNHKAVVCSYVIWQDFEYDHIGVTAHGTPPR